MTFARGARVRKPVPLDRELTLHEASFVMCSVAERDGLNTPDEFLRYMAKAWATYKASALPAPTGAPQK